MTPKSKHPTRSYVSVTTLFDFVTNGLLFFLTKGDGHLSNPQMKELSGLESSLPGKKTRS